MKIEFIIAIILISLSSFDLYLVHSDRKNGNEDTDWKEIKNSRAFFRGVMGILFGILIIFTMFFPDITDQFRTFLLNEVF